MLTLEVDDPPRLGNAYGLADVSGLWRAAQVKAQCEKRLACDLLTRARWPYYLPMGEAQTYSGRKRRVTQVPLFKGYLFFAAPADEDVSDVFQTQRVLRVIQINDQDRFRREIENVERALSVNPRIEACPFAVEGARVRVSRGPLIGVEGTVIRRAEGAMVVLGVSGFGNAVIEIVADFLEPAA